MPSSFLSLLLLALALERVSGSPSLASLRSRNDPSKDQWIIEKCSQTPGCFIENGVAVIKPHERSIAHHATHSTSKIEALNTTTPNTTGTYIGPDGERNDAYSVTLDTHFVGTGLCQPDKFLEILFQRSTCPIGSKNPVCQGRATYDCRYNDARYGYLPAQVYPNTDDTEYIDHCTMWFDSSTQANLGTYWDGSCDGCNDQNSQYSDFLKKYAIDIFKAAMQSPNGTTSSLLTSLEPELHDVKELGNKTTYQVPSKLVISATKMAGKGGDKKDDTTFGSLTVNIDCPVPSQTMDCGFWKSLVDSVLGVIPGIQMVAQGFDMGMSTC